MIRRSRSVVIAAAAALLLSALPAHSQSDNSAAPAPGWADLARIAESIAPSAVVVEYTVQYDKGESPGGNWYGWSPYAVDGDGSSSNTAWESFVTEERPAERAGYLVAADRVLTSDPLIHPRFIKSVAVRVGGKLINATPDAYGRNQNALFLKLETPVPNARPLAFDASKPGPYLAAAYREREGVWGIEAGAGPGRVRMPSNGDGRIVPVSKDVLLVDRAGTPVGFSMTGDLGPDDSWKGSPLQWPTVSAEELKRMLATLETNSSRHLVRVAIGFRSPRSEGGRNYYSRFGGGGGNEDEITEWNGTGILVDESNVVVLANLKPKVTGRLETIRIFAPGMQPVQAAFTGTFLDYGCFLAKLQAPMSHPAEMFEKPITDIRNQLLLKAEVGVAGEVRTAYYSHERISAYSVGWRRQLNPISSPTRMGSMAGYFGRGGDAGVQLNFLYTMDGRLAAVPVARREKVALTDRYSGYGGYSRFAGQTMLAVEYLREVLRDPTKAMDPENRPLTEEEENRLAWLGVEMQAMDPELARLNNVVDQTNGGYTGGIVNFVYEGSPAASAGIEIGDILLRLHVEGQPKPLDVAVDANMMEGMFDQFWQMLDQMPEEYFDQMPAPWGNAETALTRALTDIGFGTPFVADVWRNGELKQFNFNVTQGPAHYGSARRFKSEAAGLTTRDLSYEVRRYFQIRPEEPGVIISKVERGSRSAVAGLKPFELVLAVNDAPVRSVAEFEQAIAPGGELRLSIKRMREGRIVKIKIDPAKTDSPATPETQAP